MPVQRAALLAACATPPPADKPEVRAAYESAGDPLEPTNRVLCGASKSLDSAVLKPIVRTYGDAVPAVLRIHVTSFFWNLGAPEDFINFVLAGKPRLTGAAVMRLLINTTLGAGGRFDVAADFGYRRQADDLGLALGVWGVPPGPYVYVPLLGPSDVRDMASTLGEIAPGPLTFIPGGTALVAAKYGLAGLDAVDTRQRAPGSD
jgi:phospholipid-binding lipoprotein MlaA